MANHDRIDEELYQDFETEQARAKREVREGKEIDKLKKQLEKKGVGEDDIAAKVQDLEGKQRAAQAGKGEKVFFKVTVTDNGCGMSHADIPEMLGRVLSGTKYGVKQTRGKFGLGAKMALIWSKMSTGLPIEVYSARKGSSTKSYYKLDLDIQKNEPNVHTSKMLENADGWHGAELSVTIAGNWQYYRAKILKYLQQIAVITPYARFEFQFIAEDSDKNSLTATFERRTDTMPAPPGLTKHHPSSVDLELIKRLAGQSKASSLVSFLCKEFDCVNKGLAERIVDEMQMGAHAKMEPTHLDDRQLARLHQLLHAVKFAEPSGDHLSPAGEYNIRLGILKEIRPELVATHQGSVGVHEGHAFIVEAAVSVGGKDIKQGLNIYRYANRIPLLFEGGSDVITRTALKRINWSSYKISQGTDKVGVFVSIVSTKIPFKGAGKEYMADDVEEIQLAVKAAIQSCCQQLRSKIAKAQAAREQKLRKRNLTKYIPNVAGAVFTVLKSIADAQKVTMTSSKKRRLGNKDGDDVIPGVVAGQVTEALLSAKLSEHVERIDSDMALEYQMQQGLVDGARTEAYLAPVSARHAHEMDVHGNAVVLKLLKAV